MLLNSRTRNPSVTIPGFARNILRSSGRKCHMIKQMLSCSCMRYGRIRTETANTISWQFSFHGALSRIPCEQVGFVKNWLLLYRTDFEEQHENIKTNVVALVAQDKLHVALAAESGCICVCVEDVLVSLVMTSTYDVYNTFSPARTRPEVSCTKD
eukprot:185563-Amphidinium_carterae.1